MNSQGFWQAERLCLSGNKGEAGTLMLLAPGSPALRSAHTGGGLGARLLCFSSLIDS